MNGFDTYPAPALVEDQYFGVLPIDFLLETVLKEGLAWFRADSSAPDQVFGHLKAPWLSKYGEAKIDEIAAFIRKYEIKIVQHFSLIDAAVPCFSIQLLDGGEMTERAGLVDHQRMIDTRDMEDNVIGRTEVGYVPISDNVHIGIHVINTPDLAKYLYYLAVYILSSYKMVLEKRGLMLGTFRATDISRLNDFLPENMYSRFINFTVFSIASYGKGALPIVTSIQGVHVPPVDAEFDPESDTEIEPETGIKLSNIQQS